MRESWEGVLKGLMWRTDLASSQHSGSPFNDDIQAAVGQADENKIEVGHIQFLSHLASIHRYRSFPEDKTSILAGSHPEYFVWFCSSQAGKFLKGLLQEPGYLVLNEVQLALMVQI
jgi:hypothetical protein